MHTSFVGKISEENRKYVEWTLKQWIVVTNKRSAEDTGNKAKFKVY